MLKHEPRPNVLVILPHDLGDRLGCYGYQSVSSPNLDALAREGARLPNFFAAAPECTPSRSGLFTGRYTHQNGLMGLCHRGWCFNRDVLHLARALRRGGYHTHLFGLQHVTREDPAWLGYEEVDREPSQHSGDVGARFIEFLQHARPVRPWFAHIGFRDVHRSTGWPANKHFDPARIDLPAGLPDTEAVRAELCRYHQAIEEMDAAVGRMLDALDASGEAPNTLVVFVTDHGSPFPGGKSTFYDPGIRTACLIRWPGRIAAGKQPESLLSNLDLFPTILEACGIEPPTAPPNAPPTHLPGRSFLPLLRDQAYEPRGCVFGALYYDAAYDPMCCVRTRRYKYIRSFAVGPQDAPDIPEHLFAPRRTGRWIRAGDTDVQKSAAWAAMSRRVILSVAPEELYDLAEDPHERVNLADDPGRVGELEAMRARLLGMMRDTRSPLMHGHVPPDLSRTMNERLVSSSGGAAGPVAS